MINCEKLGIIFFFKILIYLKSILNLFREFPKNRKWLWWKIDFWRWVSWLRTYLFNINFWWQNRCEDNLCYGFWHRFEIFLNCWWINLYDIDMKISLSKFGDYSWFKFRTIIQKHLWIFCGILWKYL